MDPKTSDKPNQINKNAAPDMTSTVSDLHDEGVDIVDQGISQQEDDSVSEEGRVSEEEVALEPEVEIKQEPTPEVVPQQVRPMPPQAVQQMPRPVQKETVPTAQMTPKQAPIQSDAQREINQALGGSYATAGQEPAPDVKNDPSIKPLRTFKSDAEEAVRYQNISMSQIAMAEQKKKQASTPIEYEKEKSSSAGIFIVIAIVLVLAAAGAYYWFFALEQNPASALPQELRVQTLLPYAKANTIEINPRGNALEAVTGALASAEVGLNDIYALIPVPMGTTTTASSVGSLFAGTHIPNMLERSLAERYMVGAYALDVKSPFFIIKNTYFQNAFAGMLEWEKDLRNDLILVIRVSHPSETTTLVTGDTFEDIVVSNIDARALRNAEGKIILTYAFADKDTIVITTGAEALKALLDKLLAVRIVQ